MLDSHNYTSQRRGLALTEYIANRNILESVSCIIIIIVKDYVDMGASKKKN